MPRPTNQKAHAAILEYLNDGVTRTFPEIKENVPWLSDSAARSIMHKLCTLSEVDVIPMGESERYVCYRRSARSRPFLLGQLMRKAYLPAEGVAA